MSYRLGVINLKQFKVTCDDGFTKTFSAMSVDEAVDMAMADADMKAHMTEKHADLAGKTPEEMKAMVLGMTEEVMATPAM